MPNIYQARFNNAKKKVDEYNVAIKEGKVVTLRHEKETLEVAKFTVNTDTISAKLKNGDVVTFFSIKKGKFVYGGFPIDKFNDILKKKITISDAKQLQPAKKKDVNGILKPEKKLTRVENALRLIKKINTIIENGDMVLTENGKQVTKATLPSTTSKAIQLHVLSGYVPIHFATRPIASINAQVGRIKVILKKDIKQLNEV